MLCATSRASADLIKMPFDAPFPVPTMIAVGVANLGATINKSGYFKMQATKVGDDTTLAQIVRLVDEATSSKAPIAKLADKVSGVFVPVVIGIALIAVIVWLLAGYGFEFALSIGILPEPVFPFRSSPLWRSWAQGSSVL